MTDAGPLPAEVLVPRLVALRLYARHDEAEEAALVIASGMLAHRVQRIPQGWVVEVLASDAEAAEKRLGLWETERSEVVKKAPHAPDRGQSFLGIGVALILLALPLLTGLGADRGHGHWFAAGTAVAERILRGEWWRAATAMTLHGDLMHVIGNVLAALLFMAPLGRWVGAGVGALATVTGAFLANLATAAIEKHDFASVGASTATFAALGVLVGLQATRQLRGGSFDKRRAWISIGAGLALFAMLGVGSDPSSKMSVGPGVDVWGHLTGLGFGTLLGLGLGAPSPSFWLTPKRWWDRGLQASAGLAATGLLVFAWWRALRG